jgi:hypothetical protein
MTEHELQTQILDYLNRQNDFFAWRNQSMGVFSGGKWRKKAGFDIKGVADILGIYKTGLFIAIEVKRPGSTESDVSDYQKAFLNKINRNGGQSIWTDSMVDVIEFVTMVRENYGLGWKSRE